MTDAIYKIFEKRVWDANICTTSNCKVRLNGEPLPKTSFEAYAKMHEGVKEVASVTTDRWSVCIGPSEDGMEQVSFVNGICTTKGGTHVDHVTSLVASGIIEDMAKKIKLKPQQVKNAFTVFVKATLENPTFSSQVKSECTLKAPDFGSKFEPPKTFVKNALKTGIAEELTSRSSAAIITVCFRFVVNVRTCEIPPWHNSRLTKNSMISRKSLVSSKAKSTRTSPSFGTADS